MQKWVSVRVDWLQVSWCRHDDFWGEFIVRGRGREGDFCWVLFLLFFDEGEAYGCVCEQHWCGVGDDAVESWFE